VTISRAAFLRAFVCAGLGGYLDIFLPTDEAAASVADPDTGDTRFRPHVGDRFVVRNSAGLSYTVVLAEVSERFVSRGVEQFSLIFHGAPDLGLAGGLHAFRHQQLGTFDLFISPIGPPNRPRTVYQACFSRFATPPGGHRRT